MSLKVNPTPKIKTDLRPSDYEYALLSQHVYDTTATRPVEGSIFHTFRRWNIIKTRSAAFGYFGAIYQCNQTKQIVIAHRGTNSVLDIYEDFRGILLNQCSKQKEAASLLVNQVVHEIRSQKHEYQLSFTGHSLGAYLAEISVYYATTMLNFPDVSAVTFESPGSKKSMTKLRLEHEIFNSLVPLDPDKLKRLDITSYVCYPNIINSCNEHVGTLYTINVDVGSPLFQLPGIRLLNSHSISGIVDWFRMATVENNPKYKRFHMSAWPKGCHQIRIFFKYANFESGRLAVDPDLIQYNAPPPPLPPPLPSKSFSLSILRSVRNLGRNKSLEAEDSAEYKARNAKQFDLWMSKQRKKIKLGFYGNFRVLESFNTFSVMPLHHFSTPLQQFLRDFNENMQLLWSKYEQTKFDKVEEVCRKIWESDTVKMPAQLVEDLLGFEIQKNNMGIEEVSLANDRNAHEFRKDISSWLDKTGFAVSDLVVGFQKFEREVAVLHFKRLYDVQPFVE